MTSATAAGRGTVAAVTTTCVMAWAIVLVLLELRRGPEQSLLAVRSAEPSAGPVRSREPI